MLWTTVGGVLAGSALLGGLLASTDAAVRRWRARHPRRAGPAGAAEGWLLRDPRLAAVVLAALGQLRRELAGQGRPLPGVAAAFVRGDLLLLRLAGSLPGPPVPPWRLADAGPAGRSGPAGQSEQSGRSGQSGRSWVVDTGQLTPQPDPAPMPYPLLTPVGRRGGWTVLLDLARSPGPISLAGDRHRAVRVLDSLAFELAGSPWSAEVRMVAVGLAGRVPVPDPHRIAYVRSESEAAALATGAAGPLVLLLARAPDGSPEAGQLAQLTADLRPVAAICLGRSRFAGWTLEIRPDGRFRLPSGGPMLDSLAAETAARPPGPPPAPPPPALLPPAPPAGAGVRVDWPRFRELVGSGDSGTDPARLRSALGLIQAEPAPGAASWPGGRQPLPWHEPDAVGTVLRCVRRVAELAAREGNPAEAEWALRQGLRLLPQLEGLWRALLRFQAEHDPAALEQTAAEMVRTLAQCRPGARLERPTRRQLAQLGRRATAGQPPAATAPPGGAAW